MVTCDSRPLYITRRQCRWFRLLLDGGERVIMNSSAATILALIVDLIVTTVFLWQSPILAAVVALVSYPVWWLIANVVTVFCWVMTLAVTAGASLRYRLFVASRRPQSKAGQNRPVVLVVTDDCDAGSSGWLLVRPAVKTDETLLRAVCSTAGAERELPRAV